MPAYVSSLSTDAVKGDMVLLSLYMPLLLQDINGYLSAKQSELNRVEKALEEISSGRSDDVSASLYVLTDYAGMRKYNRSLGKDIIEKVLHISLNGTIEQRLAAVTVLLLYISKSVDEDQEQYRKLIIREFYAENVADRRLGPMAVLPGNEDIAKVNVSSLVPLDEIGKASTSASSSEKAGVEAQKAGVVTMDEYYRTLLESAAYDLFKTIFEEKRR